MSDSTNKSIADHEKKRDHRIRSDADVERDFVEREEESREERPARPEERRSVPNVEKAPRE
ncbi:MAG: hypothetical protein WBX15_12680 [Thermoanaerobaculia bacterium]